MQPSMTSNLGDRQAQAACMDRLKASISSILLNIGSIFTDHSIGDSASLAAAKSRLQDAVPGAMNDYHGALDALESDLIRAKAVLYRDYKLLQATKTAPSSPPKAPQADAAMAEPSSTGEDFEIVDDSDLVMVDAPADAKPSNNEPASGAEAAPQTAPMAKANSQISSDKPNDDSGDTKAGDPKSKPADMAPKTLTPATDGQGNNPLGIHVANAADSKAAPQGEENKTSPKDQNDQVSDNGFNDLLPGLSMYASDANNDQPSMMDMENMNDQSLSNAFGNGEEGGASNFEEGLFDGLDLDGGANSFAELYDNSADQKGDGGNNNNNNNNNTTGQDSMDVFSDDFFNLNG